MIKRNENRQMRMFMGCIEDLMPQEHFLRDLDNLIDFSFIYEKIESLYSNTGRPAVDPVLFVKMLLIGYLYGIDSERKLEQEIKVNIAYRWFLGLELEDNVPDHSTISQLRRRKFKGTTIFQDIFDEIVRKCIQKGLVDGKLLLTDSTHVRANVSNDLREVIEVPNTPSEYMKKLDKEAYEQGLIKNPINYDTTKTHTVTTSVTDPECGMLNRPGKPKGFHYLDHQTTDSKSGIITDVFVTAANTNDCTPHTSRLEYQIDKFAFSTEAVCADTGYDNSEVYDAMLRRGIKTYIPRRARPKEKSNSVEDFSSEKFIYNSDKDVYACPAGNELHYSDYKKGSCYKRYTAKRSDCNNCLYKGKCVGTGSHARRIQRNMHEEARCEQAKNIGTPEYFKAMRLRKIWCEGNFSHQKERHNLRRTRKRGIEKVTEQCLLSACALNLKRLVKALKGSLSNSYMQIRINNFKLHMAFYVLYAVCQQHLSGIVHFLAISCAARYSDFIRAVSLGNTLRCLLSLLKPLLRLSMALVV